MRKYLIFILLLFSLPVVFSGCSGIEDVHVVKVKDVTYQELRGGTLKLSITATVNNPNRVNVKVKKLNMDLLLNGKLIGVVSQTEHIELLGRRQKDYKLLVSIEMKDLLSNMMNLYRVLMNEQRNLSLSGEIQVRYLLFTKTFQIDRMSFE